MKNAPPFLDPSSRPNLPDLSSKSSISDPTPRPSIPDLSGNSAFLDYPRSIGDQKISDELIHGRVKAELNLRDKLGLIQREMDKFKAEYRINFRLYNAEIRFQPLPGGIYYLYETPKDWISLLGPSDWDRDGLVGGFRYTWDGMWEEV